MAETHGNRMETHACDLISRAEALNLVKDVCEAILSGCGSHYDGEDEVYDNLLEVDAILKCNKEIRTALRHLPSAQKKGHWIDEGTNYSCSECHRGCWVNSDYCPWCGARMDGKDCDGNEMGRTLK